jgi:hypothetical protein
MSRYETIIQAFQPAVFILLILSLFAQQSIKNAAFNKL